mgnify:CR=1 FL=1
MTIGIVGGWESKAGVMVRNTGGKKQVSQRQGAANAHKGR